MKLAGLHHVTMITGDAQGNVDFYAEVLGLRLVKKTVNFDDPTAYHLYFGDEQGAPGSILTWFEYAGARRGHAGAGMIHTIQLGVPSVEALDFWAERLGANGYETSRGERSLRFADWEGLRLELVVADRANPPLTAVHPEISAEYAIVGIEGARAYVPDAQLEETLLTGTLGDPDPDTFNAAYRQLAAFHDETRDRLDLTPEQTVLGGFSMGSVISYALGLGPGRPAPAGILAFSGFIPVVEGWQPELPRPTRAFVAHGRQDPIMEIGFARQARHLLEQNRMDVDYHESDHGHSIEPADAAAAKTWLADTLTLARA